MPEVSSENSSVHDPLLPWLMSVKKALDNKEFGADLDRILADCIHTFKHNAKYRNDPRFLKIWLLYLDGAEDHESVFREMEENNICRDHSLLYEMYAYMLETKQKWTQAHMVYRMGILRKAKPLEPLEGAYSLFLDRMSHRMKACFLKKNDGEESIALGKNCVNPWSTSTKEEIWKKILPDILRYDGYYPHGKAYPGKVDLYALDKAKNKTVKIGGKQYQIKGCAGQGGFAKIFKAYITNNPDDDVALKIQKPPFPWEFYLYRQLDQRISKKQRSSFGFAHEMHVYSDYSILINDYLSHGTLLDVINSYVLICKPMEELLCIYYTIEMLSMLESLHSVGLIHGDFKPDNILIRYSRDNLTEDGFLDRSGPWADQGLCLVDWGRGIDLNLFPDKTEFEGDCRTSGFRCIEMLEKRQWKFQVDTFGLCAIVHLMLHNTYMEVQRKPAPDGSYIYLPKTAFKRYWNVELWKELFTKLLNSGLDDDKEMLKSLRDKFQSYLCSSPQLLKKLKDLLAKQRLSLCSS